MTGRILGRIANDLARLVLLAVVAGALAFAATNTQIGQRAWAAVNDKVVALGGSSGGANPGGWVVAGSPEAAALPAPGDWQAFHPDAAGVDAAVAVLTRPDEGAAGSTRRWVQPVVAVRIDLPSEYGPSMRETVESALSWLSETTGTAFAVTDGADAPFVITGYGRDQGHATVRYGADGAIVNARVEVGCCRERIAWEEVLHGAGPLGDHGGAGSVFSNNGSVARPGDFDAWVLRALYANPAGTSATSLAATLGGGS